MPSVKGAIRSINLYETFCCVKVLKTDDTTQYFLLWSYGTGAQEDNAKNRLLHGMYLAIARDAFLHNRVATFTHNDGSSLVTSFTVE
jgi:hypothetical protein